MAERGRRSNSSGSLHWATTMLVRHAVISLRSLAGGRPVSAGGLVLFARDGGVCAGYDVWRCEAPNTRGVKAWLKKRTEILTAECCAIAEHTKGIGTDSIEPTTGWLVRGDRRSEQVGRTRMATRRDAADDPCARTSWSVNPGTLVSSLISSPCRTPPLVRPVLAPALGIRVRTGGRGGGYQRRSSG